MKLDSYDIKNLAEFVTALNELTRKNQVNVCAYGGIDICIRSSNVARLEFDHERGEHIVTEAL